MKSKMTTREKTFWAITIPVVLLFFTFNTLPMLKGFMYSFTNYRGYGGYDYVGFRNYKDLFTDLRVGKSYLFTFKYALVGTVLVNVLSLSMDRCFDRRRMAGGGDKHHYLHIRPSDGAGGCI